MGRKKNDSFTGILIIAGVIIAVIKYIIETFGILLLVIGIIWLGVILVQKFSGKITEPEDEYSELNIKTISYSEEHLLEEDRYKNEFNKIIDCYLKI